MRVFFAGLSVAAALSAAPPGALVIGFNPTPPLIAASPDGRLEGFYYEVLQEAARIAELRLEWRADSRMVPDFPVPLEYDLWVGAMRTPGRSRHMHFTRPWWRIEMHLVSLAERPLAPAEVSGQSVALHDLQGVRFLAEHHLPGATLRGEPSPELAAAALCRGEVAGFFTGHLYTSRLLSERPEGCRDARFLIQAVPDVTQDISIVARFDRREQAEKLREAIDQLAHEGRLSAISAKYPLVGYRSAEFLTAMTQLRNERRLLRAGFVAACAVLAVALLLAWRMRQNARRLRRARQAALARGRQLEVVCKTSQEVNKVLELRAVERTLVDSAMELTGATGGCCGIMCDGRLHFSEYKHGSTRFPVDYQFSPGEGVPGWVMRERRSYLSADARRDPQVIPHIQQAIGFIRLLNVPVFGREGNLLGCLEVHRGEDSPPFEDEDAGLLMGLASSAGIALDNALMIAAHRRLEEELRQAQRMEAIGRLAGGVAHDFNNMLTVINGYSQLALRRMSVGDPLRAQVHEILKAGERAAELTRQLLAFSRRQVLTPRLIDLARAVRDTEVMLRRLIGEQVRLESRLEPGLGYVLADEAQLGQVLLNLAVNARDAMPEGGLLAITAANVTLGAAEVSRLPGAPPGEYVRLEVSDTGHGMDEETLDHIFDPFFTTKEAGRGTGLGLATVYGIVRQSGGWVEVHSQLGHGTTFNIYLPRVFGEAQQDGGLKGEAKGRRATVLLAEDEAEVRSLTAALLRAEGYTVVEAASGLEAEALAAKLGEGFDLLLTDVVMADMGGPELARRLAPHHPRLAVVFMSGYANESLPPGQYLQKPFRREQLLIALDRALSEEHTNST